MIFNILNEFMKDVRLIEGDKGVHDNGRIEDRRRKGSDRAIVSMGNRKLLQMECLQVGGEWNAE